MKFGSGAWTRTRITSSKGWRATDCTTPEQPEKCSRAPDASAMHPARCIRHDAFGDRLLLARRFCYAQFRATATVERCPSGLRSTLGKRVLGKLNRGFKSHPLRHPLRRFFLLSRRSLLANPDLRLANKNVRVEEFVAEFALSGDAHALLQLFQGGLLGFGKEK